MEAKKTIWYQIYSKSVGKQTFGKFGPSLPIGGGGPFSEFLKSYFSLALGGQKTIWYQNHQNRLDNKFYKIWDRPPVGGDPFQNLENLTSHLVLRGKKKLSSTKFYQNMLRNKTF